jgi:4-amino-4-deoxy-L-arabinose transferase-like glycosyltransferase
MKPSVVVLALLLFGLGLRWRVAQGWVYAGSDSYGYLRIAEELRAHGRIALAAAPEPLEWARTPLYPALLAAVEGEAAPGWYRNGSEQPGWYRIKYAQIALDLLGCVLLWWMARRLGGERAGLLALALAVACPFLVLFTSAALTESLAAALTTATVAALVLRRTRRAFLLAGALAGLAALVRPDGVLLALAFAAALLGLPAGKGAWRERAIVGALALTGFLATFAWWPIRNLVQFGAPHPFGAHVDRHSRPFVHVEGYWSWLQSWSRDWRPGTAPLTCFYAPDPGCPPLFQMLDDNHAFDRPEERVAALHLYQMRIQDGLSEENSRAWQALADARRGRHPLDAYLGLPIQRAWHMWVGRWDELIFSPRWRPWPTVTNLVMRGFRFDSALLFVGLLVGGALLLWNPATRVGASVLVTAVLGRTAVLAYTNNCMPRYVLEVIPLGIVLLAAGAVELDRRVRTWRAR